jgi:hypothetical protein
MALILADRVQQTGTANTTVSFTLSGSVTGFQSFAAVGNGNTTFYAATDASGNWESGLGTYATSGPTLTRTTVYASSNSGSAVTFSGSVNVFVTYPSSRSVSLDASGNVSPLGTIASGTWNGSTIPVAYGGTGVTASSGASSVVLRDANQNVVFNNFIQGTALTTAAAGTTVLTVASARTQILVGSTTQTYQLPDATTLALGQSFIFVNNSSGNLTVQNAASALLDVIPSGGVGQLGAVSIATVAGTWGVYSFLPGSYDFNNTSATFNNATISSAVWNGATIATGYGGTGLTTFAGANNALYSSSASALVAGTLPVAAGGTGQSTYTDGQLLIGNSTGNTLAKSTLTAGTGVTITNGSGSITVASPLAKQTDVFTTGTAATYTAPANTQWVKITVVGAGANGAGTTIARATGGGAGGVAYKWFVMTAGQTLTYSVGAAGGSGGASSVSSGTATITTITANGGGSATTTAYASGYTAGPAGGTASGGDINITGGSGGGSSGSSTTSATNTSGKGGDCSGWGIGGVSVGNAIVVGNNGVGYGAGGSGGQGTSSAGNGTGGVIIFEAY